MAQGDIVSNKVDKKTGVFNATIRVNTKVDAPTVIHATSNAKGESWYPNGVNYKFKDHTGKDVTNSAKIVKTDSNEFSFKIDDSSLNGKLVFVQLDPK